MRRDPPLIAVPADTRPSETYLWHASPETYLRALAVAAGALPVIVPALVPLLDLGALLARVDGVLLTGAVSNVHPSRYGVAETAAHAPFDTGRDDLTAALIRETLARGLPLLAVCRGHQELNVALGGTLAAEMQEIPGRADHRAPEASSQDERFALRHDVLLEPDARLRAITGRERFAVNSLHRQAIDRLAPALAVEARAPDGTIEAVRVSDAPGFALGVQWHPEYWAETDAPSAAIFRAFGEACRSQGRAQES